MRWGLGLGWRCLPHGATNVHRIIVVVIIIRAYIHIGVACRDTSHKWSVSGVTITGRPKDDDGASRLSGVLFARPIDSLQSLSETIRVMGEVDDDGRLIGDHFHPSGHRRFKRCRSEERRVG